MTHQCARAPHLHDEALVLLLAEDDGVGEEDDLDLHGPALALELQWRCSPHNQQPAVHGEERAVEADGGGEGHTSGERECVCVCVCVCEVESK